MRSQNKIDIVNQVGRFGRIVFGAVIVLASPLLIAEQMEHMEHSHHHAAEHANHDMDQHQHHRASNEVKRGSVSYTAPKVTLTDQHGKRVVFSDLLAGDKPVLLNFIFTSCTAICPPMSATFAKVQSELGQDASRIAMVSVSIDPEHDTPHELQEYARRFGAQDQWSFLTGSQDESIKVQQAFDAYRGDKMNHAPLTLFRAKSNDAWVRYDGFASAADLVRDARAAITN